mgnify:CR=1 FL=1
MLGLSTILEGRDGVTLVPSNTCTVGSVLRHRAPSTLRIASKSSGAWAINGGGNFLTVNALLIKDTITMDEVGVRILGKVKLTVGVPNIRLTSRGVQFGGPLLLVLVG